MKAIQINKHGSLDVLKLSEIEKQFKNLINKGAFIRCGWDGDPETEEKIKNETSATIRCIPFEQNIQDLKCIYTSNKAKFNVIFAKAY